MKKIYLNILGIKNFETEELNELLEAVRKLNHSSLNNPWGSLLYEPINELERKIRIEIGKRERSKMVWVEFESYWSGYTSSQRKLVGKFYRKIDRALANKMPTYFDHQFTDNTSNAWTTKIVSVRGKDEGSYSGQIDEFLKGL